MGAACAPAGSRAPRVPSEAVRTVVFGAGRSAIPYIEPHAKEKARLFARINRDRAAAGLAPVAYSLRAAKAGDDFCLDAARQGSVGHWDLAGRAPYLRYAEAGGVDMSSENFASETHSPGPIATPIERLLLVAHERFMAERPPLDGHRQTVLDPHATHVGIGAAVVGGEFRMTEEFVREVMAWVEIPAGPLPAGSSAWFVAKLPGGWSVAGVDVGYEPPPRPISLAEAASRGSYAFPRAVRHLRPTLPAPLRYAEGGGGDFGVSGAGVFRIAVPLASGPGQYYVLVYAGPGSVLGARLSPCTGALIRAE